MSRTECRICHDVRGLEAAVPCLRSTRRRHERRSLTMASESDIWTLVRSEFKSFFPKIPRSTFMVTHTLWLSRGVSWETFLALELFSDHENTDTHY